MRWLELLVDLGKGAAVALVAAYLFATAMLLVVRPGPSDVVSLLLMAATFVLFSLWVVLPAGVLLGYLVPRFALLRAASSRLLLGAGVGTLLGGLSGAVLGDLAFGARGRQVLSVVLAVYVALWTLGAVWLCGLHRERRNV